MNGRREGGGGGGGGARGDKKDIHTPFLKSADKNNSFFINLELFYLPLLKTSRPGFQTHGWDFNIVKQSNCNHGLGGGGGLK